MPFKHCVPIVDLFHYKTKTVIIISFYFLSLNFHSPAFVVFCVFLELELKNVFLRF